MSEADANKPSLEVAASKDENDVLPTVFVGLGGTGMEVLLRLRRRILQADWNGTRINSLAEFPVAGFLYFDTDMNDAREKGMSSGGDPLSEAVAFQKGECIQQKADISYYQRSRGNNPSVDEWLPTRDLSNIDTTKGAGQVRAISRLLFFQEFDRFRSAVIAKSASVMANVHHAATLTRLGLKIQQNLRVVVVGSAAGGTGSGAFIDAGLAINAINPRPSRVDLFLMLPGGYASHNKDRVFANSFAALAELEHVMLPEPNPPYVQYWNSVEQPAGTKPYKDVYLFDTRNLNGDSTTAATDVFDMMSDILFEDFGNSDFAADKRMIAPNKEASKVEFFYPQLNKEYGENARRYSMGYSAAGQSTVATMGSIEHEATVVDTGRTMLEAFFGVASNRLSRMPTPEKRDEFMANNLLLKRRTYDDFPDNLRSIPPAIAGYALIDTLMQRADSSSSAARLMQDIDDGFQRIRETVNEPSDWLREAIALRNLRERDILGDVGQHVGLKYGLRGDEIFEARQRLAQEMKAETGDRSLKSKFYALLDDQENAGLDYTIELIQQMHASLEAEGQGIAAVLERAEQQFAGAADQIAAEELSDSLLRLEAAAKPGFFGSIDRKASQKILSQVQDDLKAVLLFRLRSLAAREARLLLVDDIAPFMGGKITGTDDGVPRWTGLLGEFAAGNEAIDRTLDLIAVDAERVRDTVRRPARGTFMIIGAVGRGELEDVEKAAALEWARQAFKDFGGCRALFGMLRSEADRLKVLNQLRVIAKEKLRDKEQRIPTVVDALRAMTPDEQRRTLERMLTRATPWIHGQFDRWKPKDSNYSMLIAVRNANQFEQEFGPLIKSLLPSKLGITDISYAASEEIGRIICYCELTGFPLDVIQPLREDWRKSYLLETAKPNPFPLHNHHDDLRFGSPLVPTNEELDLIRQDLALFLRAVCLGILERQGGPKAQYAYADVNGDWHYVGTEQKIRRLRFSSQRQAELKALVERAEVALQPAQLLAASVLMDWTAAKAYSPRRTLRQAGSETYPGLTNKVATSLAREYTKRLHALTEKPKFNMPEDEARTKLRAEIAEWTRVIPDSLDDVEELEANRSLDLGPEYLAVDKRRVDKATFTEGTLLRLLKPADDLPPAPPPLPMHATSQPLCIYVAIDGNTAGPYDGPGLLSLIGTGQLAAETMVFDKVTNGPWLAASSLPAVAMLLAPPPPPLHLSPPPPPAGS